MNVVVTGGAGFIGSHLVDALHAAGYSVTVIDDLSVGLKRNIPKDVRLLRLDIREEKIARAIKKIRPDVIFHLAAQKSVRESFVRPDFDASVNIIGSLRVFQAASEVSAKVIYASTAGVYGEGDIFPIPETAKVKPLSPYVLSKFSAEQYLAHYFSNKLAYCSLRFANVYGPRQDPKGEAGVIAIFFSKLISNQKVSIYGNGEQTRDFVYVEDVVRALLLAFTKRISGVYNIGTAHEISINNLYRLQAEIAHNPAEPDYQPPIDGEVFRSALANEKAKADLSWSPEIDLKTGLEKTYNWFKENKT